jgi:hypothetical protein
MYPYLPGASAAMTLATMTRERDIAEAAARSAAERRTYRARLAARRGARPAPRARERLQLHGWLLRHVAPLHLHRRPPAMR